MTAEIAIINRVAVTLAADSAVTLTVRGSEKVYNTADKLFELSNLDPMGIMIYNNLEFMGITLEVAIKHFRDFCATEHFVTIVDAAGAFFKYLADDIAGNQALQRQHVRSILLPEMRRLREEWNKTVSAEYSKKRRKTDYPGILTAKINERQQYMLALNTSECFVNTTEADIKNLYEETFNEVRDAYFSELPLTNDHKSSISQLCILVLMKDEYSDAQTGMVFAGFGEHEKFPSLVAYQVEGIIGDKLKKRETDRVVTVRESITGEILPFAQREMVDRFLYGVDPEFEKGIEEFLKTTLTATCEGVVDAIPKISKTTKKKMSRPIVAATNAALRVWRNDMVPKVKQHFVRQVQDMVFLMPKQDLATLAEEMINLTSVKRKFSSGRETVGGPIDVAVISRIDGFVWVKRKHYFTPELNPRYFVRRFGTLSGVGGRNERQVPGA
jgi:hypothetical protein